jgi:MYXO-CTERM domain-containing protein
VSVVPEPSTLTSVATGALVAAGAAAAAAWRRRRARRDG